MTRSRTVSPRRTTIICGSKRCDLASPPIAPLLVMSRERSIVTGAGTERAGTGTARARRLSAVATSAITTVAPASMELRTDLDPSMAPSLRDDQIAQHLLVIRRAVALRRIVRQDALVREDAGPVGYETHPLAAAGRQPSGSQIVSCDLHPIGVAV